MIAITWVTDLINQLPQLIGNIMYGYIFIFIYRWITHKDFQTTKYTLVQSIIINYLLINFYEFLSKIKLLSLIKYNPLISYTILSFILGFVCGSIVYSESYNEILRDLHLNRDTRDNIWQSVIKTGTWLRVFTDDPDITYLGCVDNYEDKTSDPKIILSQYQIVDLNGDVIVDYSKNNNEYVVVSVTSFNRIEVTYTKSAKPCLWHRVKEIIKKMDEKADQEN